MSTAVTPLHPLVLSIPSAQLQSLCKLYGATLQADLAGSDDGTGAPINGAQLLWAMSGRESSFGRDIKPRHEPVYDMNGRYWRKFDWCKQGVQMYGRDFACSYGPLQIMACNAKGFTPYELGSDPEKAMQAAVAFMRLDVLRRQKARTIDEICDCWNTGNDKDDNVPHEYIAAVRKFYFERKLP